MSDKPTEKEPGAFDAQAFEETLKAQVRAAGGTKAFYEKHDIIKELMKSTFQTLLEACLFSKERPLISERSATL